MSTLNLPNRIPTLNTKTSLNKTLMMLLMQLWLWLLSNNFIWAYWVIWTKINFYLMLWTIIETGIEDFCLTSRIDLNLRINIGLWCLCSISPWTTKTILLLWWLDLCIKVLLKGMILWLMWDNFVLSHSICYSLLACIYLMMGS